MKLRLSVDWAWLGRQARAAVPFLTSFVVHAAALLVLSVILFPMLTAGQTNVLSLTRSLFTDELEDDLTTPSLMSALATNQAADEQVPAMATFTPQLDSPAVPVGRPMSADELARSFGTELPGNGGTGERAGSRQQRAGSRMDVSPRAPSTTDEVRIADNAVVALASVTSSIERELEEGDTLVVWLVDASISLEHDRLLMAEHMESFYRSIGAFDNKQQREGSQLMNAVVAFGGRVRPILEPRKFGIQVCNKLTQIPFDPSGLEYVMKAVQTALQRYRGPRRDDRMMIVIITDESGDDVDQLEATIQHCRQYSVPVHVIGPSAVLGAERGSHAWTEPRSGETYLLPVDRGPDTALPQRAWLPYWHESDLPPCARQGSGQCGSSQVVRRRLS